MDSREDRPDQVPGMNYPLPSQPSRQVDSFRPVQPEPPHRDPVRRRLRRERHVSWRRLIFRFLGVLLLAVVAYGVFILIDVAHISTKPFQLSGLTTDQSGRVNVLVLGIGDPGHAGEYLSD